MIEQASVKTELVHTVTTDGIRLDGALWSPAGQAAAVGIALCAGTGAEFYSSWLTWLGERLAGNGYLALSLNRRDHGSEYGFHDFEPAAIDHAHAVDLLAHRGAQRIVLAGHSYGTLTVPYYLAATNDERVSAMILYAALGDMRAASVTIAGGQRAYDETVATARHMIAQGRGSEAFLIPPMIPGGRPLLHTYATFLNKRGPDAKTDGPDLLRQTGKRPVLALRDPSDPYPATHSPAPERLEAANGNLRYVLLPAKQPASSDAHHFRGREEEVLGITLEWLRGTLSA